MIQKYIIYTLEFANTPENCICSYLAIKDCTWFLWSQLGFLRKMTWSQLAFLREMTWSQLGPPLCHLVASPSAPVPVDRGLFVAGPSPILS